MLIIVDAYGGDNAPLEVIRGCAMAVKEYGVNILLYGDEDEIKQAAHKNNISLNGMEIRHTELVIPVEADPTTILQHYGESTMARGLKALAEGEGQAFVTAGSTGAAIVGGTFIVKRMKGVKRAAIASVIPNAAGAYLLIDAGANSDCRPEMLAQFGVLGSAYMSKIVGVSEPRVGLVNIGTEETKGTELQIKAYELLKAAPVNFVGNVEARELPLGGCDIAVCDGFTGNIVLKLTEGMAKFMAGEFKKVFKKNVLTMTGAVLTKSGINDLKKKMDYSETGGAPILGLKAPVIKAHGSSNAKAFKNAIRQAITMVNNNVIEQTEKELHALKNIDTQVD